MTTYRQKFKYRIDAPCVLCGCKTPSEKISLSEELIGWSFTTRHSTETTYDGLPCCPPCKKKDEIYTIAGWIICLVISTVAITSNASNNEGQNIVTWLIFSAILLQLYFSGYRLTYSSRLKRWLKAYATKIRD